MTFTEKSLLPREVYNQNPTEVAPLLLGKYLVREAEVGVIAGKIVEVEAYLGAEDQASHSFIGKTKRNESLFGPPGYTYVHSIHKYFCIDIVCEEENIPHSLLIRALEPVKGIDLMKLNRNTENELALCSGPGKLCQALQITRDLNNIDVTDINSSIRIHKVEEDLLKKEIIISERIGISKAQDLPLRFYIKGSRFISTL